MDKELVDQVVGAAARVVASGAISAIDAAALGGPVEIPDEMRVAALQRAMAFDTAGTRTA